MPGYDECRVAPDIYTGAENITFDILQLVIFYADATGTAYKQRSYIWNGNPRFQFMLFVLNTMTIVVSYDEKTLLKKSNHILIMSAAWL